MDGSGKWIFLAILSVVVIAGVILKKKLGEANKIH